MPNIPHDPAAAYSERLAARKAARDAFDARFDRIANLRLAVFLLAALMAGLAFWGSMHPAWLLLPIAGFVALAVRHESVARGRARADAAVGYYEKGLRRIAGDWPGDGVQDVAAQERDHPYAPDLDLFGPASLFELLCQAQTASGRTRLAGWMQRPQAAADIRARQEAVRELAPRLDLREDLARLGLDVRGAVRGSTLARWSVRPAELTGGWAPRGYLALTVATVLALLVFIQWNIGFPFLILFTIQLLLLGTTAKRAVRVLMAVEEPERELRVLIHLLDRLGAEQFEAPVLRSIRERLTEDGKDAAARIRQLERLVYLFNLQMNQLFFPVSLLLMWSVHFAFAIESWRLRWGRHLPDWLAAVGEFEALLSLAAFAWEHPDYPYPEIVEGEPLLEGKALRHPLLKPGVCVPNGVTLGGAHRITIVSGSNMSGKSTYLRVVGINVVLAQLGAPVAAGSMRLTPFQIGATLRVQDSIQSGVSRFYAELQRLKAVSDLISRDIPVLFLLDEILHGTNSHDRQVGAEALVRSFVERGAIGFVTTHDLALTKAADAMGEAAANVHFSDHLEGSELIFDYTMRPGVVEHSNALQLMANLGLLPEAK
ncbi:MAG: DNA mismatch repair protein MutS [Candidatus Hydrogenedentes bacterium]|nr:DNA mismatch repair protein MutS [Candidatus Hydrogenedentota bacterium]